MSQSTLPLNQFIQLQPAYSPHAVFVIDKWPNGWRVQRAEYPITTRQRHWAEAKALCGDSPRQYHAKYLMAVLTAASQSGRIDTLQALPDFAIPAIEFSTDEATRRSMTLNGMRMTTEYIADGSRRILQLIEQRLAAGQRDVVHDVLVYLMNQVLEVRERALEARLLRAESVAAYLGLAQHEVEKLFLAPRIDATRISKAIIIGQCGTLRRALDVPQLVDHQMDLLRPSLNNANQEERRLQWLMRQVLQRLREDGLQTDSGDVVK